MGVVAADPITDDLRRGQRPPSDVARFDGRDPRLLLEAGLCCAFCLRRAVAVVLAPRPGGGHVAQCHCALCSPPTEVLLTDGQARLLRAARPVAVLEADGTSGP